MNNIEQHKIENRPEAEMLLDYIKGTATRGVELRVTEWVQADEANEKELMHLARLYFAHSTRERILSRDTDKAFDALESRTKHKQRRIWLNRVATVAACFFGVVVLSAVISYIWIRQVPEIAPQIVTVQSNAGMRTHFSLPDGTGVYLNAGSTLTYPVPFNPKSRKVALEGEAFFDVVSDTNYPFFVSTFNNQMSVKVTGTAFNVEAYAEDRQVYTTLLRGEVFITYKNNRDELLEQKLLPSEKASYHIDNKGILVEKADTSMETAWMGGKVIFKDTPIPEVLRKLSNFYDVEFVIKDKVIENYLFTGTFNNRQLPLVLEYLKLTSDIEYSYEHLDKDENGIVGRQKIILSKKK